MGLRQFAQETPDKPAIIMAESGAVTTYAQLNERSDQFAQLFRAQGLQTGEGVAFTVENDPVFLEICCGAGRAGLYFTAISTALREEEASYIVNDCGARIYICSAQYAERGRAIQRLLSEDVLCLSVGGDIPGFQPLENLLEDMPAEQIADESKGQDLLYSSGTTGRPKGVKIELTGDPPEVLNANAIAVMMLYRYSGDTVYLSPAPLYHAAPLRFNLITIAGGGTTVIMRKFDPEFALQCIEKYGCTHSQWVPTMFVRMLKLAPETRDAYNVSSMQVAIHASAPCPVPVKEQMIDWWGEVLYEFYAGSEGNGFCAIGPTDWLEHRGSVGRPLFGSVHVVDEDGEELGPGETGTIYFSGGTDFEYLNDPAKTRTAYNERGWSTLGDVGHVDENGYLYLTDRKAYMIISGGVNVYPQETENVLIMHPAITDVAVFGVPDDDLGEQVKAVVQLREPGRASEILAEELIAYCRKRLSPIKCPKSVDFMEQLPREATGKLYKRLLKEKYWG